MSRSSTDPSKDGWIDQEDRAAAGGGARERGAMLHAGAHGAALAGRAAAPGGEPAGAGGWLAVVRRRVPGLPRRPVLQDPAPVRPPRRPSRLHPRLACACTTRRTALQSPQSTGLPQQQQRAGRQRAAGSGQRAGGRAGTGASPCWFGWTSAPPRTASSAWPSPTSPRASPPTASTTAPPPLSTCARSPRPAAPLPPTPPCTAQSAPHNCPTKEAAGGR